MIGIDFTSLPNDVMYKIDRSIEMNKDILQKQAVVAILQGFSKWGGDFFFLNIYLVIFFFLKILYLLC